LNTTIFKLHLDNSIKLLLDITSQNCHNNLATIYKFTIQPSGKDFHAGLNDFEKKNLAVLNRYSEKFLTIDQTVDLLCHDGKVPLWINMTVYESKPTLTVISLLCSRRLRDDADLYYNAVQFPPFNILVPVPPDSQRKDISGKFDVNWQKQLDEQQKPENFLIKIKRFFTS
jgi:hypothetical protein